MLAFAFLFVNSVSAFAAEFTTVEAVQSSISTQSNSFPYSSLANSLNTTTSWKTIATSNTGFSCNVFIKCMNTTTSGWGVVPSDVRMLGKMAMLFGLKMALFLVRGTEHFGVEMTCILFR